MIEEDSQDADLVRVTPAQARLSEWMVDVLVYTVVLNLFVEHSDAIIIDSFSISILTAVLLRAMLHYMQRLEHSVSGFWERRGGKVNKALGVVSAFGILIVGKLAILEVVNIVFGDHVDLGHFVDVLLLIIAMIVSRLLMVKIYDRVGEKDPVSRQT